MKQPKKPTRDQRKILQKAGYEGYLVVQELPDQIQIVPKDKQSKEHIIIIEKR